MAARQLARFALVGVSNTALSYALYLLLLGAGTPYVAAAAIAFAAGATNGYVLNRRWTFAAPDSSRARLAYLVVQCLVLGANGALVWTVVQAGAPRAAAYAVAIPPVTLASFAANRLWTFSGDRGRELSEPVSARAPSSAIAFWRVPGPRRTP